ncbi:MAG TPA: acyl-CoA dehydrogenase family protein [Candidatus Hydrogenedentes bacterium]|nr:acyl-CoA dehydrogenase family protein [Candidatus Hydrogenedentota bacterium]
MENEIRKLASDFAERILLPHWESLDEANGELLAVILKEAAHAGLFGFIIPEADGGSGLSLQECTLFLEEVSKACGSVGALLAAHIAGITPLLTNNTGHAYLRTITEAEQQGAPVLCVAAIREGASPEFLPSTISTTIKCTSDVYSVTGYKSNVLGAEAARAFTVLARDPSDDSLCWVVVPREAKGVEIKPEASRLGLKLCPMNDVVFDTVEVPTDSIVERFQGKERLLDFHRRLDPALAAVSVGMAAESHDIALRYSMERYQGGKMICEHDVIQMLLADMEVSIRASRALAFGPDGGVLSSALAAETAEKTCLDAIQILGGYGYMEDYRIERILRDVKAFHAMLGVRARKMEFIRGEIEQRR